jgi:hypothetical protein
VIPVVVISLVRAADRRAAMRQNLGDLGIAFTFFDAIEGRGMAADAIAAIAPRPYVGQFSRHLSAGEIGCAASFFAVLRRFLDSRDSFICIAEDDATFTPDAARFLDPARLASLPPFDVLRLVNDPRRGTDLSRIVAREGCHAVHAPLRLGHLMLAQVFSRAGAKAVLAGAVPLTAPIDNLLYRDVGILGLRVLEVRPPPVAMRPAPSTIGDRYSEGGAPPRHGPIIVLRRKLFMLDRRVRAVASYLRAWGLGAILRIRPYRGSDIAAG